MTKVCNYVMSFCFVDSSLSLSQLCYLSVFTSSNLVPRPHPAFYRLQYRESLTRPQYVSTTAFSHTSKPSLVVVTMLGMRLMLCAILKAGWLGEHV